MTTSPFPEIIRRWNKLAGVRVVEMGRYLETGEAADLEAASGEASTAYEPWLLEDLLGTLADPPSWGEDERRLMRLMAALQQRGGHQTGQSPEELLARWLERTLRREAAGEDWFTPVAEALAAPVSRLVQLAARTQAGSTRALSSAGRFLLQRTDEELAEVVTSFRGLGSAPAILRLIAMHATARLPWAVRLAWPRYSDYERPLLLQLLLAANQAACDEVAASLWRERPSRDIEAVLAARLPGFRSSRQRLDEALEELRRYRKLDGTVLDHVAGYLASGDRAHLAGVPPIQARGWMQTGPLDELAACLSVPGRLEEEDRRLIDVLIQAQALPSLARWIERSAASEAPGGDTFGAAREAILERGLPEKDLVRALARTMRSTGGLQALSSLARHLESLPTEELRSFLEEQLSVHLCPLFLVEEAPRRFLAELRPFFLSQPGAQRAHPAVQLHLRLLELHPELAEPAVLELAEDPGRLFSEEARAQPHVQAQIRGMQLELLAALWARHRSRHRERFTAVVRSIVADPAHPRHYEAVSWLARACGGEVLDELLATLREGPEHSVAWVAQLLPAVFGRHALPAVDWLLSRESSFFQMAGLRYLVGFRDPELAPRVEQELARRLEAGDAQMQVQCIGLAASFDFARLEEPIWKLLASKSKQVRFCAAKNISSHRGAAAHDRAARLLAHKQAPARLGAVALLNLLGDSRTPALFEARLDEEPSEEVRDDLLLALRAFWAAQGRATTLADVERRAERTRLRDDLAPWLDREKLPQLFLEAGAPLSPRLVHYMLHRQARVRGVRPDLEAEALYSLIDRSRSGDFALALLEAFLGAGGAVEESWALTLAGVLGDERVVPRLVAATRVWIKERRTAFAEYAALALALQGGDAALQALDAMALRYATKPKNVGEAAGEAFAEAAERLDLTQDELRDRVVPWLGFEPGRPRLVDCGGKTVEVRVSPDFTIALRDARSGKPVRSLPKAAPAEVAEELKELRSLLKEAEKAQSLRLENLLVAGHRWSAGLFRERFLGHPLLVPFAVRLVWGAFDAAGGLLVTFRATFEDGALIDASGAPVTLADGASVGMIHPLEAPAALVDAWKAHLAAHGLAAPFSQLERPAFRVDPATREMEAFCDFVGAQADPGHVKRTTARLAWRRGDTSGGMINDYWKAFTLSTITARIFVEGMAVVLELSSAARFQHLIFLEGETRRRLKLGEVPERVLSETLSDLEKITTRQLSAGS